MSLPTADKLKEHEVAKHGGVQPSEEEQLLLRHREQKLKAQQEKERKEKAREQAAAQEKYFGCTQCLNGFGSQKDLDYHTTREHVFNLWRVLQDLHLSRGEGPTHGGKPQEERKDIV